MFECVFEKQGMTRSNIGVGGNVVDDTEKIVVDAPPCGDYYTEADCPDHCYWWGGACHDKPEEEFPWLIIAIVAGVAIVGAIAFAMLRK